MKKVIIYFTVLMTTTISGCSASIASNNVDVASAIESEAKIVSDGKEYKCEVIHTPEQINRIKILEPKNLSGLTFSWESDNYEVSLNDLSCSFNKNFLPDTSFLSSIVEVINAVNQKESLNYESSKGGEVIFNVGSNSKITTDKDGNIQRIEIPEKKVTVDFLQ